ncbi:nitrous oxide reductase accessory protein NosL [Natrinema salsiterrestre]|uniref:Nitrous oxide reductase accessory protein NosL n=1 Tax=Natrinema salsiterrestre TaxID=2950540 RepID=A0A9Q4L7W4_9EURY|nr:nitrous oxide reductase accessory protein NosL [Natrinema salsiterrestre]MDF9747590.1 nitrous oxide reductase accessory protein NosL [Natrinema salsiterrestre]
MTGQRLVRTAISRRPLLVGTAGLASGGFAGCLADTGEAEVAEPIALTGGRTCDVCGMTIEDHYGPAGQIFYADGKPEMREGPSYFDSVAELLDYRDRRDARGRTARATFVTDYSRVDYELTERDGSRRISTHADAAAFADATDCYYVVDSGVRGAMGDEYLPFSDYEEATAFVDDHAGTVRQWHHLVE